MHYYMSCHIYKTYFLHMTCQISCGTIKTCAKLSDNISIKASTHYPTLWYDSFTKQIDKFPVLLKKSFQNGVIGAILLFRYDFTTPIARN